MTSLLGRIFPDRGGRPAPTKGDIAYDNVMKESDELIATMREASVSRDPANAVFADIWQQKHNVPFMVTIVETVQEMKSGIDQSADDR